MKKLIALLLALVMVLGLVACGAADEPAADAPAADAPAADAPAADAPAAEGGEVALVLQRAEHGWMAAVTYYAEKHCKDLGINYRVYLSDNVNDQANNIEEAIANGAAAIVLSAHNEEVSLACKKAVDAGIPLISFDRVVDYLTAYIGGDNYGLGVAYGTFICENLGGEGIVALQSVPSVGAVSQERLEGFYSVANEYPGITVIEFATEGYQQEQGLKAAADLLTANPHIDAIASQDDESSVGFLKAIEDAGRTDIKYVSGCGGMQSYFHTIEEYGKGDLQLCTATYAPSMITEAIDLAVKAMNGEAVEEKNIIATTLVSADNVADFYDENSPY